MARSIAVIRLGDVESAIREALETLVTRPHVERPFVIVECFKPSYCFVQFAGSNEKPLLLDLPSPDLDRKAKRRAEEFLAPVECEVIRRPWSLRRGAPTYQKTCKSPDDGASLALRVMRDVHGLTDDADLQIVRSWSEASR